MNTSFVRIGRLFSVTTANAGQVIELVSGSQNTRGLLVTSCTLSVAPGATGYLYADTQAPSTPGDTTKRMVWSYENPFSNIQNSTFPYPFIVDPSLTLWVAGNAGPATIVLTYDFIDPAST